MNEIKIDENYLDVVKPALEKRKQENEQIKKVDSKEEPKKVIENKETKEIIDAKHKANLFKLELMPCFKPDI